MLLGISVGFEGRLVRVSVVLDTLRWIIITIILADRVIASSFRAQQRRISTFTSNRGASTAQESTHCVDKLLTANIESEIASRRVLRIFRRPLLQEWIDQSRRGMDADVLISKLQYLVSTMQHCVRIAGYRAEFAGYRAEFAGPTGPDFSSPRSD